MHRSTFIVSFKSLNSTFFTYPSVWTPGWPVAARQHQGHPGRSRCTAEGGKNETLRPFAAHCWTVQPRMPADTWNTSIKCLSFWFLKKLTDSAHKSDLWASRLNLIENKIPFGNKMWAILWGQSSMKSYTGPVYCKCPKKTKPQSSIVIVMIKIISSRYINIMLTYSHYFPQF